MMHTVLKSFDASDHIGRSSTRLSATVVWNWQLWKPPAGSLRSSSSTLQTVRSAIDQRSSALYKYAIPVCLY